MQRIVMLLPWYYYYSMNKKVIALVFLFISGAVLWADLPAPPPWIYGQWQTALEGEEGETGLLLIIFMPNDILMNGGSVLQMIHEGYIIQFNQQISGGIYTIRLEYADGFWWEESFPMPVMTSVYIDKSFEEGDYTVMTYQFLPLGMTPAAQVPNDFE
jgi:hypothetical protein